MNAHTAPRKLMNATNLISVRRNFFELLSKTDLTATECAHLNHLARISQPTLVMDCNDVLTLMSDLGKQGYELRAEHKLYNDLGEVILELDFVPMHGLSAVTLLQSVELFKAVLTPRGKYTLELREIKNG